MPQIYALIATMLHLNYGFFNLPSEPHCNLAQPYLYNLQRLALTKNSNNQYESQNDNKDRPCFWGGMYLTTIDMIKFGQLYLQNGKWNEEPVLSEDWINGSLRNYRNLENTADKNGYGYLW